jgi:hypothetical protein
LKKWWKKHQKIIISSVWPRWSAWMA